MRWFIVSGIALAAALIAQLLIVLIPPPKDLELNKNEVSDGQNP
jgi:hypothetical protein